MAYALKAEPQLNLTFRASGRQGMAYARGAAKL